MSSPGPSSSRFNSSVANAIPQSGHSGESLAILEPQLGHSIFSSGWISDSGGPSNNELPQTEQETALRETNAPQSGHTSRPLIDWSRVGSSSRDFSTPRKVLRLWKAWSESCWDSSNSTMSSFAPSGIGLIQLMHSVAPSWMNTPQCGHKANDLLSVSLSAKSIDGMNSGISSRCVPQTVQASAYSLINAPQTVHNPRLPSAWNRSSSSSSSASWSTPSNERIMLSASSSSGSSITDSSATGVNFLSSFNELPQTLQTSADSDTKAPQELHMAIVSSSFCFSGSLASMSSTALIAVERSSGSSSSMSSER